MHSVVKFSVIIVGAAIIGWNANKHKLPMWQGMVCGGVWGMLVSVIMDLTK